MDKIDEFLFLHERLEEKPDFLKSKSIDELSEIRQGIKSCLTPIGGLILAMRGQISEANRADGAKLTSLLEQITKIVFEHDAAAKAWKPGSERTKERLHSTRTYALFHYYLGDLLGKKKETIATGEQYGFHGTSFDREFRNMCRQGQRLNTANIPDMEKAIKLLKENGADEAKIMAAENDLTTTRNLTKK
jgi:hypothetical protein